MHIVIFLLAALLLLFGGGCTLIFLVLSFGDPRSFFGDIGLLLSVWLPLGLALIVGGIALWRVAIGMKRKHAGQVSDKTGEPP